MKRVSSTITLEEALSRISIGEPVIISQNGKDQAALISLEDLARLKQMEDQMEAKEYRAALDEAFREPFIPLDQVLKEYGIQR